MALTLDKIKKMAVVGAGLMGHGIAQSYAQYGYPVTITDAAKQALAGVKDRMKANLETMAEGGLFLKSQVEAILDRVTVAESLDKAVRDADFVTEAIFENLEAGANLDDILCWFDGLDPEQVKAVIDFAARSLETPAHTR